RPATHPQLLSFPHVLKGLTLVGGSTVCGGSGLDWIVKLLGKDNLCQEASAAASIDNRLVFLPYLSGELQPINDGFARGVFFGMNLATRRADLVRAVMEATAFAIRQNLQETRPLGADPKRLIAVGGPTRNALWCQIIADV